MKHAGMQHNLWKPADEQKDVKNARSRHDREVRLVNQAAALGLPEADRVVAKNSPSRTPGYREQGESADSSRNCRYPGRIPVRTSYTRMQFTRNRQRRATLVAVIAIIALAVGAPTALARPADGLLAPGSAITVAGPENLLCTAGFVARNQRMAPVMFTAGHCDNGGQIEMDTKAAAGLVPVGEFVVSQFDGDRGEQTDVAVMSLKGVVPLSAKIGGQIPVSTAISTVYPGMQLCKSGVTTGVSCGPVVSISGSKVKFAATVAAGDSGGPVYAPLADGTAGAVGITIRNADSDGYPIAELIGPWLDRWNLTIA